MQVSGWTILRAMGLAVMALPLLALPVTSRAQDTAYDKFLAALSSGTDCPRLFELRNEAKRTATAQEQEQMNAKLRSIGCFSSTSERRPEGPPNTGGFTVKEYRIYRTVIDTPISIAEAEALQNIAAAQNISAAEVRKTTQKVQMIQIRNKWYGTPEGEIRHASDWRGENISRPTWQWSGSPKACSR